MTSAHHEPPPFGRARRNAAGIARSAGASQLEKLFLEYAPRVYRLALRCGLDSEEAEDGVQEVFLKVQRRLDTFRGEAKLSTWLYQVALHTLLDHRRRVGRQRRAAPFDALSDERGEVAVVDPEDSPPERVSGTERAALVRQALDRLPPKFKEVLVLRELEGMSYRDIARVLELAQGTVESRIFRARERLGQELRQMEGSL